MKLFKYVSAVLFATAALNSGALATDILTNRGNNARTGLNSTETILTPANVGSPSFGLRYNNPVDGPVFAQPLYVSKQPIVAGGKSLGTHNVLYVATEHDSLYAFDADSGAQLWQVSLLQSGESPVQHGDHTDCPDSPTGEIGITATPVIDRSAGPNGTIFVLMSGKSGNNFFHRLHAIDLSTGQDRLTPRLIAASVTGTGPATTFDPFQQRSRAGLLLANGAIYTAWASYCDHPPYAGWILAYNEIDLSLGAILNTDPDGVPASNALPDGSGSGIWQSANGPAADANGNIYVSTGNGPFDTTLNTAGFPTHPDFGDSVLRISPTLTVADYFTPFDQAFDTENDTDLGSAGPMVVDIADSHQTVHHLLVQSGKDTNLYVLNRDNLGKFDPSTNPRNPNIYQFMPGGIIGGAWSSPAYFNGSVYYGGIGNGGTGSPLQQFRFNSQGFLDAASSQTSTFFGFPGATPTISANGTSNGIVWAYEKAGNVILHAYDATNLAKELYNSSQLAIGGAVTFGVPTVCNGLVFVGTSSSVAAFGLPPAPPPPATGVAKDFNNDGFADLVWEDSSTGQRLIWFLSKGVPTTSASLGTVDPSWHIAGVGDFLGNGQSDLVWERNNGEHLIWILSGGIPQYSIGLPTLRGGWHVVGAGDFNGDGKADLIWENSVTGAREIWLMDGGVPTSAIGLPTVGTNWHIAGVGDFLGNGQADLVWENKITGARLIWLMNNGVPTSTIGLPTVGPSWHIAGAGDFMGTGKAGLVWENTLNGQRLIWVMNDGVPTGTTIDLGAVRTNWHIVNH
jgi:FG-GAP repeat